MVKDNNLQPITYKNTWQNSRYPKKHARQPNKVDTCAEVLNKLHVNTNNNQKKTYAKQSRNKNDVQTNGGGDKSKNLRQEPFQSTYLPLSHTQMHPQLNVVRHIMMQEKIWPYTYCKMPTINFILPHLLNTVVYVVYPGYGIHRSNPNVQIQIPKPKDNGRLKNLSCFNCGASGHLGNDCTEPGMEEVLLQDSYHLNYSSMSDMYLTSHSTSSCSSSSEVLDLI